MRFRRAVRTNPASENNLSADADDIRTENNLAATILWFGNLDAMHFYHENTAFVSSKSVWAF
jgi:hypothetical protein